MGLKVRLEEAASELIEAKTAGYVFTGSDKKRRASCEGEQDEGDGLAGKAEEYPAVYAAVSAIIVR